MSPRPGSSWRGPSRRPTSDWPAFGARLDARWLATLAFAAFGLSYFIRAGYTTYGDFTHFMLPLMVQGVAMSAFFMAMLTSR